MKIKTKKQFTLPQLIEWGFENGVHGAQFKSNRGKRVGFRHMGHFWTEYEIVKDELFTVEVEEEITEDTSLSMIIEIDEDSSCWVFENTTLKNIHETDCGTNTTKYYRDEDENMHIIWRDGKLVE